MGEEAVPSRQCCLATVLSCKRFFALPLWKGEMLWFFFVWLGVLCLFFTVFLFLRSLFGINFGSEPCTFLFFCFCSRRVCVIARFGRASFVSGVFLGLPFWAPCVFFRILSELAGLERARPFFLGTRGRQGFFLSFLSCRFCCPLLWCLRLHTFFRLPSR